MKIKEVNRMSVATDPSDSRRLALAMNRAGLTPPEQLDAADAATRAASWKDLPQWLRNVVAETEREYDGSA
jgi:hypothetical protein